MRTGVCQRSADSVIIVLARFVVLIVTKTTVRRDRAETPTVLLTVPPSALPTQHKRIDCAVNRIQLRSLSVVMGTTRRHRHRHHKRQLIRLTGGIDGPLC